jgi:hypothetical protein
MKHTRTHLLLAWALTLGACSSAPPAPEWKIQAQDAVAQASAATLNGQEKTAQGQWQRALVQSRRTAQATQLARVELIRCAVERASWVTDACPAFDALREQSSAQDQAYARYLRGQTQAQDIPWLPEAHREVAKRLLTQDSKTAGPSTAPALAGAIAQMPDPLSRLVAVHAALQHGKADLACIAVAVDSASDQGWQKALLGWLALQERMAEQSGDRALAQSAQARLKLLLTPAR